MAFLEEIELHNNKLVCTAPVPRNRVFTWHIAYKITGNTFYESVDTEFHFYSAENVSSEVLETIAWERVNQAVDIFHQNIVKIENPSDLHAEIFAK